jgi:glycosyltransferase involved in cell wall biosynthesis
MNITWHLPRLASRGCGMSRRARDLASTLASRGHDVTIYVDAAATDVVDDEIDGVRVQRGCAGDHRPPHWSLQARARRHRADDMARHAPRETDVLVTCQPEFAAAAAEHGHPSPRVVVACCSQLLYRDVERVARSHRGMFSRAAFALDAALLRRNEREGLHHAAAVAFDSRMTRDATRDAYGLGADRCRVVAPTVDTSRFAPPSVRARLETRRLLGIPERAFTACWTGRMEDRKNVALLLDAVAATDAVGCLLLVGDGGDRAKLEARAERLGLGGRVRFVGMQSRVMRYLWAADVFVLPSQVESFGISVIEAMACGLPCIVPATQSGVYCGAADAVEGAGGGMLLESLSTRCDDRRAVVELASHLLHLSHDRFAARDMGRAGRAHVVAHFARGRDADEMEAILHDVRR